MTSGGDSTNTSLMLWNIRGLPSLYIGLNQRAQYVLESVSWACNSQDELWLTAAFESCSNTHQIKIMSTLTQAVSIFSPNRFHVSARGTLRHRNTCRRMFHSRYLTDVSSEPLTECLKSVITCTSYKPWIYWSFVFFLKNHSIILKAYCSSWF